MNNLKIIGNPYICSTVEVIHALNKGDAFFSVAKVNNTEHRQSFIKVERTLDSPRGTVVNVTLS